VSAAGPRRRSRVPQGQLERLGRIGWMAGELTLGGALEKVRRLAGGAAAPSAAGGAAAGKAASALLSGANARRLAKRLSAMRGAAMKLGQLLSLEGDDLLPSEFAEALAVLRADGDAMPDAQRERLLAEEWGAGWRERFAEFDPEPIAAASIGQVHRAVARDGRVLALKIQYPGVASSIESDVDNLVTALRWSRLLPADVDLSGLAAEARRQLVREADYEQEAASLERYGALLADEPGVAVPRVHRDLTTQRVLAMDFLPGVPLEDLCGPEHAQERRDVMAALLYRLLLREIFELRFVQSDPNFANFLWLPGERRLGLVDLGAAHPVAPHVAAHYARLLAGAMAGSREALRGFAFALGYVRADEPQDRIEGVVDALAIGCEPFAARGPYDFARSDLTERLRSAALELAFVRGHRRPPPVETLFLQRKFAGTFLVCARLRARVDLRALAAPFIEDALRAA
jgi:predicted unusual protein kinase regulating ubiquinone biosynthesis (AarF/ABC1/UbiB family)